MTEPTTPTTTPRPGPTARGQVQPIAVRPGPRAGRYTVVTGERRWRAAVAAGLPAVSAVVLDGPGAVGASDRPQLQLVENALREGLTPVDQARAFRSLADGNGWSARRVAEALQVHYSTVTRSLALLRLPEPLLDRVESGRLSPRTALEIARLDDPGERAALAARVVAEVLTLRETADAVRAGDPPAPPASSGADPDTRVFSTAAGVVTVEVFPGAGFRGFMAAVFEVVHVLRAECEDRASKRQADDAPPGQARRPVPVRPLTAGGGAGARVRPMPRS